ARRSPQLHENTFSRPSAEGDACERRANDWSPKWSRTRDHASILNGTQRHGPQPSMPGPFRQAYLDVKGEQSLEQLGLAIKMKLAEPAARYLFAAVFE